MSYTAKNIVRKLNLRQKLMIVAAFMVLIRIGSMIRLPFVNAEYMKALLGDSNLGVLSILTGNSMSSMGIFALSISPYISASIIIQLLSVVFPTLEEMAKDGKTGQENYKKIIRYTGIGLALLQAAGMAVGFGKNGLVTPYTPLTVIAATITWTIGASILIAIGEFLDLFGIGSGISMLLFLNIVSTVPNDVQSIYEMYVAGKPAGVACLAVIIGVGIAAAVLFICNVLTSAEKRITIITSKKVSAYSQAGNTSTMPIPFLTCSVMPVIFTSSILSIPLLLARIFPSIQNGLAGKLVNACSQGNWFQPEYPLYSLGIIPYVSLTVFFAYFYLAIQYNPLEIADNLKKSGSVIPGIRPGKSTAEYIDKITKETALAGNACLIALIIGTTCIMNLCGIRNMALGGTSAIIAVSVVNDMRQKISAELVSKKVHGRISSIALGRRAANV